MNSVLNLKDVDLKHKKVIIREDFNVPMQAGVITSDARIQAALPTLRYALEQQAKVIIVSHLGRPTAGTFEEQYSLRPVAQRLQACLGQPVHFIPDWPCAVDLQPGEIALAENVRFLVGEVENDDALARAMAQECDVFVMDAFAVAHRANASTAGIARFAPVAVAGFLLQAEITALSQAFAHPARPLLAIIGGSKVSTKILVLKELLAKVEVLILGGGIINTVLASQGIHVGRSLCEPQFFEECQLLLRLAAERGVVIPLPTDVVVSTALNEQAIATVKDVHALAADDMILDIGPQTRAAYAQLIHSAQTIVWNGPVGVFEIAQFAEGTFAVAQAIVEAGAYALVGGGDTIAALEKCQLIDRMSYVSTAGGAFIEFLEGKKLPGLKILEERARKIS
jgi:phosphoglycerate kinase